MHDWIIVMLGYLLIEIGHFHPVILMSSTSLVSISGTPGAHHGFMQTPNWTLHRWYLIHGQGKLLPSVSSHLTYTQTATVQENCPVTIMFLLSLKTPRHITSITIPTKQPCCTNAGTSLDYPPCKQIINCNITLFFALAPLIHAETGKNCFHWHIVVCYPTTKMC